VLVQALLAAPMFEARWRHNANRSLAVLRRQGGRKVPPYFQRMRAADLLTVVFPDQVACAENLTGPRQVPDHPLVKQTVRDCLEEVMDIAGLEALLGRIERGELRLEVRDLTEPSPLAMEILNARPYAFLDDAPLEERRTQAVMQRRWLDPQTASTLGALDPQAIARVRLEAWPAVSTADELHDALMTLGALTEAEGLLGEHAPLSERAPGAPVPPDRDAGWSPLLAALQADGRACRVQLPGGSGEPVLWVAAEWRALWRIVHPDALFDPAPEPPAGIGLEARDREGALLLAVRARLLGSGPVTAAALARDLGVPPGDLDGPLAGVEAQGLALRGRFTPGAGETEWCERGLLARIHRYTLNRLRREIEPVSPADYMRFLLRWHRVAPGFRREDEEGLLQALEQLEGFEAPAASWETELLPARVKSYDGAQLDRLCLAGRAVWARLSLPTGVRRAGPVATTPIAVMQRPQMPLWWALARPAPEANGRPAPEANGRPALEANARPALETNGRPTPGRTAPVPVPQTSDADGAGLSSQALQVRAWLSAQGASFFSDIVTGTGLLPTQAEEALGELVYLGLATADSFSGLRTLLVPAARKAPVRPGKLWNGPMESAGRWALLKPSGGFANGGRPRDEDAEGLAFALLRRYGVLFRRVLERERLAPRWGDLVRVLRRLEARGLIRGGHFIAGVTGEQFALPEAVTALRELRRSALSGDLIAVSAADPLNLCGIVVGPRRVPALAGNRVVYRDGLPIAVREAEQIVPLTALSEGDLWACRLVLEGRPGLLRGAPLRLPG
jgi:ATP-dependent Lhr-like helicase